MTARVTRGVWLAFALASGLPLGACSGCRRKGNATIGDKRAFTCAEVPEKDAHQEVDLGGGRKLVRDGVRAELRGVSPEAPVLVTSLDGGSADLDPRDAALVMVVGLGGLDLATLSRSLRSLSRGGALVVALAGPRDDVEVVRNALSEVGPSASDGGVVRAVMLPSGLEVIALPGSDDPASLAEHGRGCVLRADDLRALAQKLGRAAPGRVRVAVSYSMPRADTLPDVSVWMVGGPYDGDAPDEVTLRALPAGSSGPSVRLPVPRLLAARTTSAPAVVPPGAAILRVKEGTIVLSRTDASDARDARDARAEANAPKSSASGTSSTAGP